MGSAERTHAEVKNVMSWKRPTLLLLTTISWALYMHSLVCNLDNIDLLWCRAAEMIWVEFVPKH